MFEKIKELFKSPPNPNCRKCGTELIDFESASGIYSFGETLFVCPRPSCELYEIVLYKNWENE